MEKKSFKRTGGTRFPNYSLKQVITNLKDFLSKTHTKTINIEQLNVGVFKVAVKSLNGKVRYSSLKQFGLATGEYSSITSTTLASSIELSSGEEKVNHLRAAFFNVITFKNTFETFQNSSANKSKIISYAVSTLKVHPNSVNKFIESLLESAECASLCTINGDDVKFHEDLGITNIENQKELDENGESKINTDTDQIGEFADTKSLCNRKITMYNYS